MASDRGGLLKPRLGLALLGLVLVAALAFLVLERSQTATSIRVGVLHSFTGTMALSEARVVDGTLLAIDEINRKGGVLGHPIEPLVADGRSDEAQFAMEAERLITKEKVCTVFGCWTSASRKTVKPLFEKYNHLLIYPIQYEGLEHEYIDGGSLKELLDRRPGEPLDIPTVVRITREIAQALGEAHRLGILHRDIKPANILLTNDGGVKVADLGLAREFGGSAAPTLTAEYVVVGTAAYMAPEQIEGLQEIDARADLYALGAVLYEMLTGRPPFEGGSPMVVLSCHLFSPVTPPSHHVKTVPPWLEAICLQLLAKSRNDRYASHEKICADLADNAGAA